MTLAQQRAQEIFLSTAVLDNNFTPNSEAKIAEALKIEGFDASSSGVGRWKKKFGWEKLLKAQVTASIVEDKTAKAIIANSSLDSLVKKTEVDIKQNNRLITASYQVLEYEMTRLLQIVADGKRGLTEDEFDRLYKIARLSTDRYDRMLDRLASMPPELVSPQEIMKRMENMRIQYEKEDVEEAEIVGASRVTLTHTNEDEE